jgi:hypothetical protein
MKIRIVGSWVVLSLMLSGCPVNEGGGNQANAGAVQGCIAGAVAFGAIAVILGKNSKTTGKSAAAGCLAGAIVGYQIAQRTQRYADANKALDEEARINRQLAVDLSQRNKQLEANIAGYKKEIASIRASKLSAQDKKLQLTEMKKIVNAQKINAQKLLANLNKEIVAAKRNKNTYSKKSSATEKKKWQNEIVQLEQQRSLLNQKVNTLQAIGGSL